MTDLKMKRWYFPAFLVPFIFWLCVSFYHSLKESKADTAAPLSIPLILIESTLAGCLGLGTVAAVAKFKKHSAP